MSTPHDDQEEKKRRKKDAEAAFLLLLGVFLADCRVLVAARSASAPDAAEDDALSWTDGFLRALGTLHTSAALAGAQAMGGSLSNATTAAMVAQVAQSAIAEETPFVRALAEQLENLDDDALLRRMRAYQAKARATAYHAAIDTAPMAAITWHLGGEDHCERCPELARGGPYSRTTLPTMPGACETPCLFNCRCWLEIDGEPVFELPPSVKFGDPMNFVKRTGKFFECGKPFTSMSGVSFGISLEEADAAIGKFQPFPLNMQHTSTWMDGSLGQVERLWRTGNDIHAEFSIPDWLDEASKSKPVPLSSEWDTTTKTPFGCAIVVKGAVRDAVMMAAFARHETREGQSTLQHVHDICASSGAVCQKPGQAKMAAKHEMKTIQSMHDMAVTHGATCNSDDRGRYFAAPEFDTKETDEMPEEKKPFTWNDFKALFASQEEPASAAAPALAGVSGLAGASGDARALPEDPRVAQLTKQVALMAEENIGVKAEAFASQIIADKRALPSEKPGIIAQFAQALRDDAAVPSTVKFALPDGKQFEGTRTELVLANYAARPAHQLTQELVREHEAAHGEGSFVQFAAQREGADKDKVTPERRQELLAKSDAGQLVLNGK